ncbi:hypothetical protein B739_0271 [Riemerella anatipestifer RA-CH-1]|uniref:Uncharacterized protein n=1 Tax=Riemerella anatipestifer RA-CH-1 TaxID=1228997 RepID=J9R386_RIEAN|nr:hypothetical protein B739_0271 [Riemerella anatipestifer RA-CH-1]AIH01881.1 hypothetical protein M949_0710 [Riemerella anatipestifer CH3]
MEKILLLDGMKWASGRVFFVLGCVRGGCKVVVERGAWRCG